MKPIMKGTNNKNLDYRFSDRPNDLDRLLSSEPTPIAARPRHLRPFGYSF